MAPGTAIPTIARLRRNGVALTVLAGLVLIGLFAVTQSGVAILAVARFGDSFDQVATSDVPNLVAASQLSELSQSLVATTPEIAGAGSQMQRRAIADQVNDRLAALTRAIDRIDPNGIDPSHLRDVRSQLETLTTNLKALNDFVRRRIEADDALETVMARLPALASRVREVADDAIIGHAGSEAPYDATGSDRTRLIGWSAAGLEGITLMLATPAIRTTSRLERVKLELQGLVTRMEGLRQQLTRPLRARTEGMHEDIAQFGLGNASIFDARRAQIEMGTASQTALRLIEQSSGRLVASVSAILSATQQEIRGRSESVRQTVAYYNLLIVATSLLCLVAGTTIFLYVRRAVIVRLKGVQEYMRAEIEGRPATISTAGEDEIAEIAEATQVFVTERNRAQRQIEESERRTRTILEGSPIGAAITTEEGRFLFCNSEFARQHDISRDDLGAVDLPSLFADPLDRPRLFERVRREGVVRHLEIGRRRADGETWWCLLSMEAIDYQGERAILSWTYDITERKKAEEIVRQKEAQLREILGASPIGVMISGRGARHLFSNARWRELGRVPDGQVDNLDVRVFFQSEGDRRRIGRLLREQGHVRDVELEVRALDGTLRWLLLAMEPITFEGKPAILSWYYDYSERRRIADELRVAKETAEAATEAKSTFLATMSHEIRTPMNGVLGLLELLQQTALDPEQRELTDVVRESASSLLKIIDDILDFSKIEAGRIEIERVAMSPLMLVEGVADALAPQAHKKKLQLATFVDSSVPPTVAGDPVRLRQILFNLIGNALKFTEQGEVAVRLSVDAAAPGGMMLRAEIRDTGIGLAPEERARLFQPFVQADDSTTRRFGGTGLGLSICRRLVDRMGGEIGVDSTPGDGSTFWFTMAVGPSAAPAREEADLTGVRVLAVEADGIVQDLLRSYLVGAGAEVEISHDADAALGLLQRYASAGLDIDAIMVGWNGPGLDAWAFRRAVEQTPGGAPPCLLLAAYDEPVQRGRALDAGFAAYLTMPVRRAALLRAIAVACGYSPGLADGRGSGTDAVRAEPPAREAALAAGELILVAEDNPTNQLVIARQLAQLGYAVDLEDNGRSALERFRTGGYGLVVTDIHMPEMDGLELTAAIRDLERTEGRRRVPILALTADVLVSEAERYLAAGMDDHLRKPVSLAELQDAVGRWLPRAAPPTVEVIRAPVVAPGASSKDAKVLDLEQMRQAFGSIDGTAVALLKTYLDTTTRLLSEIDRALAARSLSDLRFAAHSARGAAQTAGADELAAILTDLEVAIRAEAWDDATALQAQLVPAFARVKEAVKQLGE